MSEMKFPLKTTCSSGLKSVLGEGKKMQKYLRSISEAASKQMCLYLLGGGNGKLKVI